MKKHFIETSVGIFVLIGLLCTAYLTVKLGKMEWFGNSGDLRVSARFGSVSGLKQGAMVDMAGVQIGKVERIDLDVDYFVAVVWMKIDSGVPIDVDAIASIKTSGLIGDKYVKIEPGGAEDLVEDGGEIIETESAVDLEEVIGKYAFGDAE